MNGLMLAEKTSIKQQCFKRENEKERNEGRKRNVKKKQSQCGIR